jgi:hypothetical protein
MRRMKKLAAGLVVAVALSVVPVAGALAGSGNGVSGSQGSNSFGNAVSSGAQPQPAGH